MSRHPLTLRQAYKDLADVKAIFSDKMDAKEHFDWVTEYNRLLRFIEARTIRRAGKQ